MPKTRKLKRSKKNCSRRRYRGGFYPSVMGGFLTNAQATVLPMAAYRVYRTFVDSKQKR